jgi:hypothetical protein
VLSVGRTAASGISRLLAVQEPEEQNLALYAWIPQKPTKRAVSIQISELHPIFLFLKNTAVNFLSD